MWLLVTLFLGFLERDVARLYDDVSTLNRLGVAFIITT